MRVFSPFLRDSSSTFFHAKPPISTKTTILSNAKFRLLNQIPLRLVQTMQIDARQMLNSSLRKEYGFKDVAWFNQLGGLSSLNHEIQADGKHFVLKQYRSASEDDIDRMERISIFLQSHDLPVFPPLLGLEQHRHFTLNGNMFALYPKIEGYVLHEVTLSDPALEATARLLARFHQLNPSTLIGLKHLTGRLLVKDCIEQNADKTLSLIARRGLDSRTDQLARELVHAKLAFLKQFSSDDLFYPYTNQNHLVHGDFHNENLLFDASHQNIVRLLDFEETHLGHRVEDVIHFILLACCNSGYGKSNLRKAQVFLRTYSEGFPLSQAEIRCGLHLELFKDFSSFFIERSLFETRDLFFAQLIERDIKKVAYFRTHLSGFLKDLTS